MPPFFFIITATYNAGSYLPRLLESLAAQTCRDFAWVVQDGASTDSTLTVVEEWQDKLPAVSLESAPDKGIYDAWNRALIRQGDRLGQWVLFIGADDFLAAPDVLERAKRALEALDTHVILGGGDIIFFNEENTQRTLCVDVASDFAKRYKLRMPLPHPSLFARGSVFSTQYFDTKFCIAGDYDWLLRVWTSEGQAHPLGFVVTRMALSGMSNDEKLAGITRAEQRLILRRHFPLTWKSSSMYLFLYGESLLFDFKMSLKRMCVQSAVGRNVWGCLQTIRKRFVGHSS